MRVGKLMLFLGIGGWGLDAAPINSFSSTVAQIGFVSTASFNFPLPAIVGQVIKRDIAADFTVIQTLLALAHGCLVPIRFGIEENGLYERKWETIAPVFATDVVCGLLSGHVGGMVCRAWRSEYEPEIRTFFKSVVAGLFSGAIWGAATSMAWVIASRGYRGRPGYEEYNLEMYGSIGAIVVISGILHPVIITLRY